MLSGLKLHGGAGTVLWGYRAAVEFASWRIAKDPTTGGWVLRGTSSRVDAFAARQRPLLFTAPREGGRWAWVVNAIQVHAGGAVVAQLGQPEQ